MSTFEEAYQNLAEINKQQSLQISFLSNQIVELNQELQDYRHRLGEDSTEYNNFGGFPPRRRLQSQSSSIHVTEEDVCIFQVKLTQAMMSSLEGLFSYLDNPRGTGYLDEDAFSEFNTLNSWEIIREYFDFENNYEIDFEIFVRGFGSLIMESQYCSDSLTEISYTAILQNIFLYFEGNGEAFISEWQSLSNRQSKTNRKKVNYDLASNCLVHESKINPDVLDRMMTLFDAFLDESLNADSITAESFDSRVGSDNWHELLHFFDVDNSGTIERSEFVQGFVNWVKDDVYDLEEFQGTMSEYLDGIDEVLSRRLIEKLNQFDQYVEEFVATSDV